MKVNSTLRSYSVVEEWLNSISHGVGFIVAIVGLVFLLLKASTSIEILAVSVYGTSLILMFLTSTLYHSIVHVKLKYVLKLFDHSAIYLLIAGTNTPFLMLSIGGTLGVGLTIAIWSFALFGVGFKWWAKGRFPKISVATYLIMGWFALLIIYPLYKALSQYGFTLLVVGGVMFTIGVLFYTAKKYKYTHAIWHLFVIGGCGSHYFAIYHHVI